MRPSLSQQQLNPLDAIAADAPAANAPAANAGVDTGAGPAPAANTEAGLQPTPGIMLFAAGVLEKGRRARERRGLGNGDDDEDFMVAEDGTLLVAVDDDVLQAGARAADKRA